MSQEKSWIIQRCIDAMTNHYEAWTGYENPMTHDEVMLALKECNDKWPGPDYEFRGHNINHQSVISKSGAPDLVKTHKAKKMQEICDRMEKRMRELLQL